jgi:hypothetical protein
MLVCRNPIHSPPLRRNSPDCRGIGAKSDCIIQLLIDCTRWPISAEADFFVPTKEITVLGCFRFDLSERALKSLQPHDTSKLMTRVRFRYYWLGGILDRGKDHLYKVSSHLTRPQSDRSENDRPTPSRARVRLSADSARAAKWASHSGDTAAYPSRGGRSPAARCATSSRPRM